MTIHHEDDLGGPESPVVPADSLTPAPPAPSPAENRQAVPVFERSGSGWRRGIAKPTGTQSLVGITRGRKYVVVTVPVTVTVGGEPSTPEGVQVAEDRTYLDTDVGFQLNPGDSMELDTEAQVWVAPLPGNDSGYVQFLEVFNPEPGPSQ